MSKTMTEEMLDFIRVLDQRLAALNSAVQSKPPSLEKTPACRTNAVQEWKRAITWVRRIEKLCGACDSAKDDGVLGLLHHWRRQQDLLPRVPEDVYRTGQRGFAYLLEPSEPPAHRKMMADPRPFWNDAVSAVESASIIIRANTKAVLRYGNTVLRLCIDVVAEQLGVDRRDLASTLMIKSSVFDHPDQPVPVKDSGMLTKNEVATLLNRSTRSVDRLAASGLLPKLKAGAAKRGHCLYRRVDVLKLLVGHQPLP